MVPSSAGTMLLLLLFGLADAHPPPWQGQPLPETQLLKPYTEHTSVASVKQEISLQIQLLLLLYLVRFSYYLNPQDSHVSVMIGLFLFYVHFVEDLFDLGRLPAVMLKEIRSTPLRREWLAFF